MKEVYEELAREMVVRVAVEEELERERAVGVGLFRMVVRSMFGF